MVPITQVNLCTCLVKCYIVYLLIMMVTLMSLLNQKLIVILVSPMLDEAIEYLEGQLKISPKNTYEIIVVSDGSVDNTVQLAESYSEKFGTDKIRCLKLFKNRGKGGAVRMVNIFNLIMFIFIITIQYNCKLLL